MEETHSLKRCCKCGQDFPATKKFFYAHKPSKGGLHPRCKNCFGKDHKPRPVVQEGYKRCSRCKEHFPATLEYFSRCESAHDHLTPYCKPCTSIIGKEKYLTRKSLDPTYHTTEYRRCSRCKEEKPCTEEFFHKNPTSRYGLNTTCKQCVRLQKRRRIDQNPEKYRVYHHLHYEQNKERIADYHRAWYQAGGKETIKANTRNRRARMRLAVGSHTAEDIENQLKRQKSKCYYCKKKLKKGKNTYHADHAVPLSRGGSNSPDNLVITCPTCNLKKNNKLPHEWPEGGRLL